MGKKVIHVSLHIISSVLTILMLYVTTIIQDRKTLLLVVTICFVIFYIATRHLTCHSLKSIAMAGNYLVIENKTVQLLLTCSNCDHMG